MSEHTIWIPHWSPARLNELMHCHWTTRHKRKMQDQEMVGTYAKMLHIPPAEGKRRVELTIILKPRQRAPDADSLHKSLLDACVSCGLLVDDHPKWVELAPVQFERGTEMEWGTRIRLVDVDAE